MPLRCIAKPAARSRRKKKRPSAAGAREVEIDAAIEAAMSETGATTIKQMGLVMKAAQAKLAGKRSTTCPKTAASAD